MSLLLHVKYEALEFVNLLLNDSTESADIGVAIELSDEYLTKEYQRAQLEVKLYGDALTKERRSREVSSCLRFRRLPCTHSNCHISRKEDHLMDRLEVAAWNNRQFVHSIFLSLVVFASH